MIQFIKNRAVYFIIATFSYLVFLLINVSYQNFRNQLEDLRDENFVFDAIERLDLFLQDNKMRLRGESPAHPKVALIAIDDDSINELGRWPWDRSLMSQFLTNILRYEPKAVGLDIIFSEPQTFDQGAGDLELAQTVEKHQAKLILGTFANLSHEKRKAYQDFCMNEAFLSNKGDLIAKLNPNLALIEEEQKFDSLDLSEYFKAIFQNVDSLSEAQFLKERNLTFDDLKDNQKNYLQRFLAEERESYCRVWLTDKDPFMDASVREKNFELLNSQFLKAKIDDLDQATEMNIKKFQLESLFHPIPESLKWTANIEPIQASALYSANFNAFLDNDGKVRRMPLVYRTGNRLGTSFVPSLALQTYLVANNFRADVEIKKQKSNKYISHFKIMNQDTDQLVQTLPVDQQGRIKINFYGPTFSIPHIPARELMSSSETMKVIRRVFSKDKNVMQAQIEVVNKKEFLKDSLLIVGATAVGVYDLRNTPLEKNFPGPEIHTHLLSNLQQMSFLKYWSKESIYIYLVAFIFIFVYALSFAFTGAVASGLVFLSALGALLTFDYFSFVNLSIVFSSTVLILIFLILLYFTMLTYKFLTEEKNKKELKGTFAKYVSPAIVDEILKSPDKINLGGEKKEVSIFFSDVRGFTTLSEKLDPQKLSDVLNHYLTPMTNIILQEKGTLDKYIGDAIMAFFGAPLPDLDHAKNACKTALLHVQELKVIQQDLKKQGIDEFDIGIGINCGEVSVGNMGSNLVRNYTVMGDAVNLASRLEGITKTYGVRIVVSEFIYEKVKNDFYLRKLDLVRVKGKNQPIQIFELMDFKVSNQELEMWIEQYHQALELYFSKKFNEALIAFQKVLEFKAEDKVSKMYIERISDYQFEPPEQNWDGVFEMKTK